MSASNMADGVNVMQQHVTNRDYILSRNVMESLRTWQMAREDKYGKMQTVAEFE